ncbi:torsin-1A-like isoform X2 [Littorina saxatilis]|uniref:Torsin-1A C-terminal domain-containing protein n=1 Tax=Littorina saxatilis TaxID=31220 RepID=A0AAN9B0S8_9CAEN
MNLHSMLLYWLFLRCVPGVLCLAPIPGIYAVGAAVTSFGIASFNLVFCRFYECCDDRWIVNNITGLQIDLKKRLYGQHLVQKVVTSHIQGHVRTPDPHKALVLSFHGPTGTGKNHVSQIVAEMLYKKGLKSENVRLIAVTKEFPHAEMVPLYKDQLREMIEKQVKKCGQSLFIFDEVDKMPGGLLDTIKPYLDHYEELGGVDYRHAIFVFLSNAGGTAITQYALDQWKEGSHREDIKLAAVERILAKAAINSESQGGLWHSELISKHLVTAFLPFLPLERTFVRQCIRDQLVLKRHYPSLEEIPEVIVEEVMQELSFYPEKEQLFSVTGCKRVPEKVDLVMLS